MGGVLGYKTYCCKCGDNGAVEIWHPKTLSALRAGDDSRRWTCAVACTCRRGVRYAKRLVHGKTQDWLDTLGDKPWHCIATIRERTEDHRCIFNVGADVERHGSELLKSFISSSPGDVAPAEQMANYEPSFEDWS